MLVGLASDKAKCIFDARRPAFHLDSVGCEERERKAIHSEGHARRVGWGARLVLQTPGFAEVFAMVVEAHTGSDWALAPEWHEQFEFESLLELPESHDLTNAAEERVTRLGNLVA